MRIILLSGLYVALLFQDSAYAYIDPGTVSIILQALAAAGVTVLIFGKRVYYGILGILRKADATKSDTNDMEGKPK